MEILQFDRSDRRPQIRAWLGPLLGFVVGLLIGQHPNVREFYQRTMAWVTASDPRDDAITDPSVPTRAHVVAILDGDTLDVDTPNHQALRIRLADIDAPERRQPYWWQATAELGRLVEGHEVEIVGR